MECDVPAGWRHWGGLTCSSLKRPGNTRVALGGTYNYYNASQWGADFGPDGEPVGSPNITIHTGVHQSEFLGQQVVQHMGAGVREGRPFFIHATPLMVHYGVCYGPTATHTEDDPYWEKDLFNPSVNSRGKVKGNMSIPISVCPTVANKAAFAGLTNPHKPSWNASEDQGVPSFIRQRGNLDGMGCCDPFEEARQDAGFRNRSAGLLDLDHMLGTVFGGARSLGVLDNTYVLFSSDNGC